MQLSTGTMNNRATQYSNTTQKTSQDKKMMLIFYLLLRIYFQHIGAEAVYCIKELQCNVTECFKMRDSENAVCSSIQQTEHCSMSGTRIKLECEAQLTCFCNEEGPFELDEFPEIPVKDQSSISMENEVHPEETKAYEGDLSTPEVPERNNTNRTESSGDVSEGINTNRTESSGSSMTPLQIAAAAAVPALVALLVFGAITCYVWKAIRKQGHREPQLDQTDPQRQPLEQAQNDRNDASVQRFPWYTKKEMVLIMSRRMGRGRGRGIMLIGVAIAMVMGMGRD
ncbi:uncharacterized protein LOC135247989 [Anguilla rostrata]|uniref:uncharacterized protein LOC135247989 n=1 Tax=Anguilla rostrata TaxID=7938 RepID=UPI0030D35988